MDGIFLAVVLVALFFAALLSLKYVSNTEFCVLCTAVSATWILLLGLYYTGYYQDPTAIALLVGQSIVGLFYLFRETLPEGYVVFSLPFLLTATVVGYALLVVEPLVYSAGAVALLWVAATLLFAYRENERVGTLFEEVIACCRDW